MQKAGNRPTDFTHDAGSTMHSVSSFALLLTTSPVVSFYEAHNVCSLCKFTPKIVEYNYITSLVHAIFRTSLVHADDQADKTPNLAELGRIPLHLTHM